ncbi:universal stress protein [Sphingomicrobium sediminis]|uniref:Universal stress protein n=1 Tax=Sphingomicrobium sediminis TaxID=2950949 RepID=A0A9X2ELE7_9SPHN|nr:universal stress protein [Sphingomicrobium sediminis]MCM8557504.1 universal stress protein [Sphingomicrobium sediminis]
MPQTYLVIVNERDEAKVSLRFAAKRALKTDRSVDVLAIVEPQEFVSWGGVQAAIEEEDMLRVEAAIAATVGEIVESSGLKPNIIIRQGDPIKVIKEIIHERDDLASLVLGAAPGKNPGPIVKHFTGEGAGDLPCPVLLVPGGLDDERIELLA